MLLPIVATNSGAVSEAISGHIIPIGDFYGMEMGILKAIKYDIRICNYNMTKFTKERMVQSLSGAI